MVNFLEKLGLAFLLFMERHFKCKDVEGRWNVSDYSLVWKVNCSNNASNSLLVHNLGIM